MGPIAYQRAAIMYGSLLHKPALENCGIGPFMAHNTENNNIDIELPTYTYDGPRHTIDIAGAELELIHCPGETDDHTAIFYPKYEFCFWVTPTTNRKLCFCINCFHSSV